MFPLYWLILKVPWMVCLHTCWLERTLPLFFVFFRSKDNTHQNTHQWGKNRPKSTKTIKHNYIPCYEIENQPNTIASLIHVSLILLNIYKTSLVLNPYLSSVVILKFVHKLFDTPLLQRYSLFSCECAWDLVTCFQGTEYCGSDAMSLPSLGHNSQAPWLPRLILPAKIQGHRALKGHRITE